jgi:hypothetical protein
MTTSRPHLDAEERADARLAEQIRAHVRHYLAYLDARMTLLEIDATRASVAFERAEGRDDEERAAQATIASLSAASKALFAAVVEQERLELQGEQHGRGVDPDEATASALRRLRDEANGIGTEGGKGLIPRGTPEAIKWYAVDVAALRAAPSAAAYAAGSTDAHTRRRVILQAGAALAVLLLALIWLFVPKAQPRPEDTSARVATANGSILAVWPVRALIVTATHGETLTVPISPTTTLGWPDVSPEPRAYWHSASVWPLRLCLPPALLRSAEQVRLLGDGASPDRLYTLTPAPASSTDLILAPCAAGDDAPAARAATLTATVPPTRYTLGDTVRLPVGPITPAPITLTGPGQDPTLPPDQARVSVRVRAPETTDWPVFAPTLVLPNGAAVLPSDSGTVGQEAELRYLIPLPSEPLPVMWQLTPDSTRPVIRWRATLDPPPSRAEILRAALVVEQPTATAGEAPGTIAIAVVVGNRGATRLQLTQSDITLAVPNQPPSTPDLPTLRQPLAPGERRTLTLTAPLEGRATLTLTIGVSRFAIARETES